MSNETATLVKLSAAEQAAKGDVTSRELVEAPPQGDRGCRAVHQGLPVDVALEQADAFDAKSDEDKAQMNSPACQSPSRT